MVRRLAGLLSAALLPARLRDRVAFRFDLPLETWAAALSLTATVAGGIAWALGWLAWMEGATGAASQASLSGQQDATVGSLMFLGPLQALAYLFTPMGAALGYLTLSGLGRSFVWAAIREVPGDPMVALAISLGGVIRHLQAKRRAGTLFSEGPPDRLRAAGEGRMEIVCAEARREFAVGATVEVDGHFYEVVARRAGQEGRRSFVVYTLRELPPESVLRGLVRYR
jgi:hypothetical protein